MTMSTNIHARALISQDENRDMCLGCFTIPLQSHLSALLLNVPNLQNAPAHQSTPQTPRSLLSLPLAPKTSKTKETYPGKNIASKIRQIWNPVPRFILVKN